MSNTKTKDKLPKEFTRHLIKEYKAQIATANAGIKVLDRKIQELVSVYQKVASGTKGLDPVLTTEGLNKLIHSGNIRHYIYDAIMQGRQMYAGENFPITREAGITMMSYHSEVDALWNCVLAITSPSKNESISYGDFLDYLVVFEYDHDGIHVDEIKKTEFLRKYSVCTETADESEAYELFLEAVKSLNKAFEFLHSQNTHMKSKINIEQFITQYEGPDEYGYERSLFSVAETWDTYARPLIAYRKPREKNK